MKKKDLIKFLEFRKECMEAFLRDCYTLNLDNNDVMLTERELLVIEEILHLIK